MNTKSDEDDSEIWRGFTTMIPRPETSLSVLTSSVSYFKEDIDKVCKLF